MAKLQPTHRVVGHVVEALLLTQAHKATKYLGPKVVVRACRRLERGRVPKRGNIDIVLTIGRPNSAERKFVKDAQQAGERFPIRNIQIKYPPKRR